MIQKQNVVEIVITKSEKFFNNTRKEYMVYESYTHCKLAMAFDRVQEQNFARECLDFFARLLLNEIDLARRGITLLFFIRTRIFRARLNALKIYCNSSLGCSEVVLIFV